MTTKSTTPAAAAIPKSEPWNALQVDVEHRVYVA